jgi:hypothetical protein
VFQRWLNKDAPSADTYRYNSPTQYKIELHTTDQPDAGFDGDVYVKLVGMYGSSDETPLVNDALSMAPSDVQTYTVSMSDVGSLDRLEVRLVATGKETKWHMAQAVVTNNNDGKSYVFPRKDWVEAGAAVQVVRDMPQVDYKVSCCLSWGFMHHTSVCTRRVPTLGGLATVDSC